MLKGGSIMPYGVPKFKSIIGKETVGVFDDTLGALTILKALKDNFPHQKFIYFADESNMPFEHDSLYQLHDAMSRMLQFFTDSKLTIIASGVMSADFLGSPQAPIRKNFITVAECLVDYTVSRAKHERVVSLGVLATKYVVDSGIYPKLFKKKNSSIIVNQVACPELSDALEKGRADAFTVCKQYIGHLPRDVSHIILGEAYYNTIIDKIRKEFPHITIIDPYEGVIQAVGKVLKKTIQPVSYITTRYSGDIQRTANRMMGETVEWQEL